MSVRQAEDTARALMAPAKEAAKRTKSAEVVSFENDLQEFLGTKVEVKIRPEYEERDACYPLPFIG
ncbi:MAG: hypothetical protein IKP06_00170 [Elusimicrobiaceae bacterium]|nr:hypothetical protein [Elusimicrobiaceae bacterium]